MKNKKMIGYVLCAICWIGGVILWFFAKQDPDDAAVFHASAAFAFALGAFLLGIFVRLAEAKERQDNDKYGNGSLNLKL